MNSNRSVGFKERIAELFEIEKDKNPTLTQEEFAQKCGATRNQLKGWLSGNGSPSPTMMKEIAIKYNVSADWLVGLSDNPNGDPKNLYEIKETLHQMVMERSEHTELTEKQKATLEVFKNLPVDEQQKRIVKKINDLPVKHQKAIEMIIDLLRPTR